MKFLDGPFVTFKQQRDKTPMFSVPRIQLEFFETQITENCSRKPETNFFFLSQLFVLLIFRDRQPEVLVL